MARFDQDSVRLRSSPSSEFPHPSICETANAEYLIGRLDESQHISLLPFDLFQLVWKFVAQQSFPIADYVLKCYLILVQGFANESVLTGQIERQVLQDRLRSFSSLNLIILPVPRTLLELFYIRGYLRERISTDFSTLNSNETMSEGFHYSLLGALFLDHHSEKKQRRLTKEDLSDLIQSEMAKECFALANFHLQTDFIASLQVHLARQQRLLPDQEIFRSFAQELIEDLQAVAQRDQSKMSSLPHRCTEEGSRLSLAYDVWPLTSPLLRERLESKFESLSDPEFGAKLKELELVFTTEFNPRVVSLRSSLRARDMTAIKLQFSEIMDYIETCESGELLGLLVETFTPLLLSSLSVEDPDLKSVRIALNYVEKVDSVVHSFRKPGFVDPEFIMSILDLELSGTLNQVILFRATWSIVEDDLVWVEKETPSLEPRPHSLSFGSSLFGGIFFDLTASFYHLSRRHTLSSCYAIVLDKSSFQADSIFFCPPFPFLLQLTAIGEFFHPRTKVLLTPNEQKDRTRFVSGILNCSYAKVPSFLLLPNERQEDKTGLSLLGVWRETRAAARPLKKPLK